MAVSIKLVRRCKTFNKELNKDLNNFLHQVLRSPSEVLGRSVVISSDLVRAQLYPVERCVGFFNCKRPRWQICIYINETDSFTSTVTEETYNINHKFDCIEKCLNYLLTCNKCRNQYEGQTVDTFHYRWNNYRSNFFKYAHDISCMQEHLYEHFCEVNIVVFLITSQ